MNRKNISFPILLQYILSVIAKLSLKDIDDVVKDIEHENIVQSSILNPVFGYLFESTAALSNIRFYGPGLVSVKDSGTRNYSRDSSSEPVVNLLIKLFPSPTGTVCHIRNRKNNFGLDFKNNQQQGIEFLSDMFVQVLIPGTTTKYVEDGEPESFKKVRGILCNFIRNSDKIFKNTDEQMIKLMTIHAFIINALDDKNDLKKYLSIILESMKWNKFKICNFNFDITTEILKIQKSYLSFPYSGLNQPPSNAVIPVYDRNRNEFVEDKTFSDCVDVLLLNICNCLFYDSENLCYSVNKLDQDSELAKFYKKNNQIFTITNDIRKEWSKVIQGLDDFPIKDTSKYKLHSIVYLKDHRNELDTGIINMMNVLIKICGLDHSSIWYKFDGKNIEEKLQDLFILISHYFSNQRLMIKVLPSSFTEFDSSYRIDFQGCFSFNFTLPNKSEITIINTQTNKHAEMKVAQHLQDMTYFSSELNNNQDSNHLLGIIFETYMSMAQNHINETCYLNIFNKIYFAGPIITNNQKKETLITILNAIELNEENMNQDLNDCEISILEGMTNTILDSVNLDDYGTRLLFMPCLVYYEKLKECEVIECWHHSFNIEGKKIYKLWKNRIQQTKISNALIDISMIPKHFIPFLFDTLSEMPCIKELFVLGIIEERIQSFTEGCSKLTNLTYIDLSNNNLGFKSIQYISEMLAGLKHLTRLDISNNSIGDEGSKYISMAIEKLNNLEVIDLSFNDIGPSGALYFAFSLKKLSNLKSINLADNNLQSIGAQYIALALTNHENLNCVDFFNNKIDTRTKQQISLMLETIKSLEYLNLSENGAEDLE